MTFSAELLMAVRRTIIRELFKQIRMIGNIALSALNLAQRLLQTTRVNLTFWFQCYNSTGWFIAGQVIGSILRKNARIEGQQLRSFEQTGGLGDC